ncbi:MoxR family ATPase [Gordonia sp. NB41Y]|uniref:MadB family AAA-type ATPase n=1 Tax=Gordonia sp. NB41Y TaxID=875808 RepID=UPI0006B176A3|nr:MoxR family ATPase [Gordonia sp. NB41Y]KOY48896.1 ATPase AAA [Gordonia sp. NB41Y]WLP92075.1 MoxR family ATPase [Gordonia sp. NB41Y]
MPESQTLPTPQLLPSTQTTFDTVDDLTEALRGQGYLIADDLAVVVHLATLLDRPLLLEGPAGVGKTELAKSLAAASGRDLIRLQCYEGLDESRALYEWDYARQLLHVQMLRDRIGSELAAEPSLSAASAALARTDVGVYTEDFLVPRPLLAAIRSATPTVLLVDEIDRTDESMEAVMLEVLAERQVTVPELGTFTARSAPWVVLTSNDTRELSPALKRRCLHFQVAYPDADQERRIVGVRAPEVEDSVIAEVVELARRLRDLPLRKSPSIAEVIDAARAASLLRDPLPDDDRSGDTRRPLLSLLVKFGTDLDVVRRELDSDTAPSGRLREGAHAARSAATPGSVGADGATATGSVTATAFGAGRARSNGRR